MVLHDSTDGRIITPSSQHRGLQSQDVPAGLASNLCLQSLAPRVRSEAELPSAGRAPGLRWEERLPEMHPACGQLAGSESADQPGPCLTGRLRVLVEHVKLNAPRLEPFMQEPAEGLPVFMNGTLFRAGKRPIRRTPHGSRTPGKRDLALSRFSCEVSCHLHVCLLDIGADSLGSPTSEELNLPQGDSSI